MSTDNFGDDAKRDAMAQITGRGYRFAEVSKRLGMSTYSLYAWKKQSSRSFAPGEGDHAAEIRRSKQELYRVIMERGFLKKQPPASHRIQSKARLHRGRSVVIDLFSRRVVGRSLKSPQTT